MIACTALLAACRCSRSAQQVCGRVSACLVSSSCRHRKPASYASRRCVVLRAEATALHAPIDGSQEVSIIEPMPGLAESIVPGRNIGGRVADGHHARHGVGLGTTQGGAAALLLRQRVLRTRRPSLSFSPSATWGRPAMGASPGRGSFKAPSCSLTARCAGQRAGICGL